MKKFLNGLRYSLARFFAGRCGADQLGLAMILSALILQVFDTFLRTGILSLLGTALYVLSIVRMFSKNIAKRAEENRRFMAWYEKARTLALRYWTRLKNCREYKYFNCPGCKASIRMKRGMGEKEITCPRCGNHFKQKS